MPIQCINAAESENRSLLTAGCCSKCSSSRKAVSAQSFPQVEKLSSALSNSMLEKIRILNFGLEFAKTFPAEPCKLRNYDLQPMYL